MTPQQALLTLKGVSKPPPRVLPWRFGHACSAWGGLDAWVGRFGRLIRRPNWPGPKAEPHPFPHAWWTEMGPILKFACRPNNKTIAKCSELNLKFKRKCVQATWVLKAVFYFIFYLFFIWALGHIVYQPCSQHQTVHVHQFTTWPHNNTSSDSNCSSNS